MHRPLSVMLDRKYSLISLAMASLECSECRNDVAGVIYGSNVDDRALPTTINALALLALLQEPW